MSEHGRVSGAANMRAEIYARGPISCSIDATENLDHYVGGIFAELNAFPSVNHIIAVIGWGEEDGIPYW